MNFKNYEEVLGRSALALAVEAEEAAKGLDVLMAVAPPTPMLYAVASGVRIPVFSQKVDDAEAGKSTGAVVPESVKAAGGAGSLLNHSESRVAAAAVAPLVARMKKLGLATCLCAEGVGELSGWTSLAPDFLAIEPPELIGSGKAVSRARPALITDAVEAARRNGYAGTVLCGAGIVSGEDVRAARRLGAGGILVASSVVKARDRRAKVRELGEALVSSTA